LAKKNTECSLKHIHFAPDSNILVALKLIAYLLFFTKNNVTFAITIHSFINHKKNYFKMKKISMILFAVVLMVSFAACNGAKKENPTETVETETVDETVAPETPAYVEPAPAEVLKAFQEFAKEYGEAFNNITKDPGKYSKLASQVQEKVADMERLKVNLTPAQIKDYERALKIITDVSSGGTKK
jgi:hypothetical protein